MWHKTIAAILTLILATDTLTHATCPGDINVDLRVDTEDLMLILEHWGKGDPDGPLMPWDLNWDGRVNTQDILVLFQVWGLGDSTNPTSCYPYGAPHNVPAECIVSVFSIAPGCEYVWGSECHFLMCQQKECHGSWCP